MEEITIKTQKILEATRLVQENVIASKNKLKHKELVLNETDKNLQDLKTLTQTNLENLNLISSTNTFVKENVIELRQTLQNVCTYINEIQSDLKAQQQEFLQSTESSVQASNAYVEMERFERNELKRLDELKETLNKQYVEETERKRLEFKQIVDDHLFLQNEFSRKTLEYEKLKKQFEETNEKSLRVIKGLEDGNSALNEKYISLVSEEETLKESVENESRKVEEIVENEQKHIKTINNEINEVETTSLVLTKTLDDNLNYKEELLKRKQKLEENKQNIAEKCTELEQSVKLVEENSEKSQKKYYEELELKNNSIDLVKEKLMKENEIKSKLIEEIKAKKFELELIEQQLTNQKTTKDKLTEKISNISNSTEQLIAENNAGNLTISEYKSQLELLEIDLNQKITNLQQLKSEQSEKLLKLQENYNLEQKLFQEKYETHQNEIKTIEESNNIKQEQLAQLEQQSKQLDLSLKKEIDDKNQTMRVNELLNVQYTNMSKELTKLRELNLELKAKANRKFTVPKFSPPKPKKIEKQNSFDFNSSDLSSIEETYKRRVVKHKRFTKKGSEDKENKNKRKKY